MKDFDKWNEVKQKTNSSNSFVMVKEGEICWCKFGLNIGFESFGKGEYFSRPVLIIKKFSKDVFWGIPITSKYKDGSWYFYLKNQNKTLVLNQMRLLDRKRLLSRISEVSEKQLMEIKDKILLLLKS